MTTVRASKLPSSGGKETARTPVADLELLLDLAILFQALNDSDRLVAHDAQRLSGNVVAHWRLGWVHALQHILDERACQLAPSRRAWSMLTMSAGSAQSI